MYRDRDRYLARALRTANRMEALVGEILSVSRMESGAEAEKRERLELSALVSARLDAYAELLEQRGMTLELRLTPGVYVEGDAALLGRAVDNLLSNAVRYSPEEAEVRVTVRAEGVSPFWRWKTPASTSPTAPCPISLMPSTERRAPAAGAPAAAAWASTWCA